MARLVPSVIFAVSMLLGMTIRFSAEEENQQCQPLIGPRVDIEKRDVFIIRGFSQCCRYLLCEQVSLKVEQGFTDIQNWQAILISLGLGDGPAVRDHESLATQKPVDLFVDMPEFVGMSAISPTNNLIAIATVDDTGTSLSFLELGTKKPIKTDIYKGEGPLLMKFSPDGKVLVVGLSKRGDEDKPPRHWVVIYNTANPKAPEVVSTFLTSCPSLLGLSWLAAFPGRSEVLVGWNDPYEWNGRKLCVNSFRGDTLFTYQEDEWPRLGGNDVPDIADVQISPSGRHTGIVYKNGKIRIYNSQRVENFKQGSRLLRYPAALYLQGAISWDERWLFVGGLEYHPPDQDEIGYGVVHIWDLNERRLAARYRLSNSQVVSLAVSPDGRWLAVSDSSGRLQVLELPKQFHKTP